jgi:hypothetical protein
LLGGVLSGTVNHYHQTRSQAIVGDLFVPNEEKQRYSKSDHETLKMARLFLEFPSSGQKRRAPKIQRKVHFAEFKDVRTAFRMEIPYVGWLWPADNTNKRQGPKPCSERIGFVLSNEYEDSKQVLNEEPHELIPWKVNKNFILKIENNEILDVEWSEVSLF